MTIDDESWEVVLTGKRRDGTQWIRSFFFELDDSIKKLAYFNFLWENNLLENGVKAEVNG